MGWKGRAACRDLDVMMLFFGPEGETRPGRDVRERKAKVICASCPVCAECLDEALGNPVRDGIWAGLNWEERSMERRRRARRASTMLGQLRPCPFSPSAGDGPLAAHPVGPERG